MKKSIIILFISLAFLSCKTKKNATDTSDPTIEVKSSSEELSKKNYLTLMDKHYAISRDFNTLQIQADVNYSDLDIPLKADIRIEKGKMILISVQSFFVTGAKILITPERVSYYEKIQNTHYDGDFRFLNHFLGTDLDYQKVENLLLGEAIYDLRKIQLAVAQKDKQVQMSDVGDSHTFTYTFNQTMQLLQEVIAQNNSSDRLVISYNEYQNRNSLELPKKLNINVFQKKDISLSVNYQKITLNEKLSMAYNIPRSSKPITL